MQELGSKQTSAPAGRVGLLVGELRRSGMAMEAIARELAVRGAKAARWGAWTVRAVENVLAREGFKT